MRRGLRRRWHGPQGGSVFLGVLRNTVPVRVNPALTLEDGIRCHGHGAQHSGASSSCRWASQATTAVFITLTFAAIEPHVCSLHLISSRLAPKSLVLLRLALLRRRFEFLTYLLLRHLDPGNSSRFINIKPRISPKPCNKVICASVRINRHSSRGRGIRLDGNLISKPHLHPL